MWIGRACHRDAVRHVAQAVVSFILNGVASCFLSHARLKPTTLDHKVIDDTVKNSAVIMTVFDVLHKIGDAFGGFYFIKFKNDVAEAGSEFYFCDDGCFFGV